MCVHISCLTKGVAARLQKALPKVAPKMLGNFEVIVQIRLGGLPSISEYFEFLTDIEVF